MIITIIIVLLLLASVYFLLYAIQLHGWVNPNPPVLEEQHKEINRRIYRQAYGLSAVCALLAFLSYLLKHII